MYNFHISIFYMHFEGEGGISNPSNTTPASAAEVDQRTELLANEIRDGKQFLSREIRLIYRYSFADSNEQYSTDTKLFTMFCDTNDSPTNWANNSHLCSK